MLEAGPGSRSRVLAAAGTGATCMAVAERWLEPGAATALHRHPEGVEEAVWVRSGEGEFRVGRDLAVVGAGCTVVIPPLAWHSFRAVGAEELVLFVRWSAAVPATLGADGREGEPEVPGTR